MYSRQYIHWEGGNRLLCIAEGPVLTISFDGKQTRLTLNGKLLVSAPRRHQDSNIIKIGFYKFWWNTVKLKDLNKTYSSLLPPISKFGDLSLNYTQKHRHITKTHTYEFIISAPTIYMKFYKNEVPVYKIETYYWSHSLYKRRCASSNDVEWLK